MLNMYTSLLSYSIILYSIAKFNLCRISIRPTKVYSACLLIYNNIFVKQMVTFIIFNCQVICFCLQLYVHSIIIFVTIFYTSCSFSMEFTNTNCSISDRAICGQSIQLIIEARYIFFMNYIHIQSSIIIFVLNIAKLNCF